MSKWNRHRQSIMRTMPNRRVPKSVKLSWAGILLLTNFLSLYLPVRLLSKLRIHSQAASVYVVCCSENANTFSIMNIWETPVEKSSDSIPRMLLAVTVEKQAADRIRKCGGLEEGCVLDCCFQFLSPAMPCCKPPSESKLVWLVAFLIFNINLSFYNSRFYLGGGGNLYANRVLKF